MGRQRENQSSEPPPHTAGCYAIPIRFLYGTAAECNFWDVIYFRASEGGGVFDTSTNDLVKETGLSRQMVGKLRREALERGELTEDVSWVSGRRFILQIPAFDRLKKGVIWKPHGYVRNGWHQVVTPAIPKRVLNLYLQQPRQSVYDLAPKYIAAKCKRRILNSQMRPVTPLNLADVGKALQLLVQLGLLKPEGLKFRIAWDTFNQPAPAKAPSFDLPDPREHPLFQKAAVADRERAERAVELLSIGHFDMATHFSDIFRDLAYVRGDDYTLLEAKAHRYRNRPPSPNRWRVVWKAFQHSLKRRAVQVRGPKSILRLDESATSTCALTLDIDPGSKPLLAVRMTSRVEWPWHLEASPPPNPVVQLKLQAGDMTLFTRAVNPGDAEVRYTLHPDKWPGSDVPLMLKAQCDRPLPHVHVEAWLEARLRR